MREQGRGRGRDGGREGGRVMTVSSGTRWRKERNCGEDEVHGERRRDRDNTGVIKRARMDRRLRGGGSNREEDGLLQRDKHNEGETQ